MPLRHNVRREAPSPSPMSTSSEDSLDSSWEEDGSVSSLPDVEKIKFGSSAIYTAAHVSSKQNLTMKDYGKPAGFECEKLSSISNFNADSYRHFSDAIVIVKSADTPHESLQIHKSLLMSASPAIANAFNQPKTCLWDSTAGFMYEVVEGETDAQSIVHLSWNSDAIGLVRYVVGWLYTGFILQCSKTFEDDRCIGPSLMVASRLWVFANKIKNSALANDAMNACYEAVSNNTIILFSPNWSIWVYENTAPDATLRKFAALAYGVLLDPSVTFDYSNGGMQYPKELMIDVFRFTTTFASPNPRLQNWVELDLQCLYLTMFREERGLRSRDFQPVQSPQDRLAALRKMAEDKLPVIIDISDDGCSSDEAEETEGECEDE